MTGQALAANWRRARPTKTLRSKVAAVVHEGKNRKAIMLVVRDGNHGPCLIQQPRRASLISGDRCHTDAICFLQSRPVICSVRGAP
ncbi:hypothetical protein CO661_31600 [Sinorhizobium fredii]|uniref:Uncharacterized protein n=1 Tax=Rhizobium fredii TaxID=380 RepID=A0A2A6LP85_RHIFR|nr:hypothetical protein SF83666_c27300 [Sinorhizobium fredii CCBAU 83666]PDT44042.1 hypothetical protein CO661_31600 [Sinorhizobium fredii]